jgi:hypothetical protein
MPSSPRQGGGMSSPPRGRSRGTLPPQRVASHPIGAGSLSASGSETFAHYHVDGHNHHGGLAGESSSASDVYLMAARLSCNNNSFEELPDEKSSLSVGGVEAEESMQSVASTKVSGWRVGWGEFNLSSRTPDSAFRRKLKDKERTGARSDAHTPHTHTLAFPVRHVYNNSQCSRVCTRVDVSSLKRARPSVVNRVKLRKGTHTPP